MKIEQWVNYYPLTSSLATTLFKIPSTNKTIPHSELVISLNPLSCLDMNENTYLIADLVNNAFLYRQYK